MLKPITFYSFIVCPYAIRTRTTLEELQIPYEYKEIDLLTNRHLTPEYLVTNPMHKVPALKLENGEIIYESLICCEYLDQDKKLHTTDRLLRARIDMWVKFYDHNITTKKWNMLRFAKKGDINKSRDLLLQIQGDLKTLASRSGLTERIKNNRKSYLFGNAFSMADVGILPLLVQDRIIFKFLMGIDILQDLEEDKGIVNFNGNTNNQDLEAVKIWLEFAKQRESYKRATTHIQKLPTWEESPLLKDLGMQNSGDWDFEKYYTEFATRKFLGGQKPKL